MHSQARKIVPSCRASIRSVFSFEVLLYDKPALEAIVTVGEKLKRERKKQKLSLETISEKTKIALLFLIAIEEDDIAKLPGGIYSRNFLRAYAGCLGMDQDIITAEFHEQHNTKPTSVLHREQTTKDNRSYLKEKRKGLVYMLGIFLGLFLLGFVGYLGYQKWIKGIRGEKGGTFEYNQPPPEEFEASENKNLTGDLQDPVTKQESGLFKNPEALEKAEPGDSVLESNPAPEASSEMDSALQEKKSVSVDQEKAQDTLEPGSESTEGLILASELSWPERPILDPGALKIANLNEGLEFSPAMEDLFIVFAEREVWLEVSMDGRLITRRLLNAGSYRAYLYGELNEIVCGDFTRISFQDGRETVSTSHMTSGVRETLFFERGMLKNAVLQKAKKGERE